VTAAAALDHDAGAVRRRAWCQVRNLLVVRLDNLGDVLMATPAIAALRAGLPGAQITLLASPSGAAAVPFLDDVDAAIVFAAPWVKGDGAADGASPGRAEVELVERLRVARFDAAVILTTCTQSALPAALACRMAGIPLRLAHCRENPYGLLSDWAPERDDIADDMRHEVERQLALVASVGFAAADRRLRFMVPAPARSMVVARLTRAGVDASRPLVIVHPGASAAAMCETLVSLQTIASASTISAPSAPSVVLPARFVARRRMRRTTSSTRPASPALPVRTAARPLAATASATAANRSTGQRRDGSCAPTWMQT